MTEPAAPIPAPSDIPAYNEHSIEDVGVENRLSRANGAVWFSRAVTVDHDGNPNWTYFPEETVTFRFEYTVRRPVRDLAFLFRLYLAADEASGRSELIVTDIYEVLSSERAPAGVSAIVLTLPGVKLMPNEFSLYVWLGRCDRTVAYDVLDTNVSLPKLVIKSRSPLARPLRGLVPLSYEIQKLELESRGSGAAL